MSTAASDTSSRLKVLLREKELELQRAQTEWERRMQHYDRYMQREYDELNRKYQNALKRIEELEAELARYRNGRPKPTPAQSARLELLGEVRCASRVLAWLADALEDLISGYRRQAPNLPQDVVRLLRSTCETIQRILGIRADARMEEALR